MKRSEEEAKTGWWAVGREVSGGGIANCDLVLGKVRGSLTQEVAGGWDY